MDTSGLPDDFHDLIVALADAEAEFLLVGGYALLVDRGTWPLTDAFARHPTWASSFVPR